MKKLTYDFLYKNYVELEKSTYEIAEMSKTYPNKIRRALVSFGIPLRDKSEAQSKALATGRCQHPTKGKKLTEETKIKISDSMANCWEEMDEKERKRRSVLSRKNWESMSLNQLENMQKRAGEAIREAAESGSKLEKFLINGIRKNGFRADFHKEIYIIDEKQHIDIYVPEVNTAIEIDGPTHFKAIWGDEKYEKQVKSDSKKTGFILNSGMKLIRIKNIEGNSSGFYMRAILKKITETLKLIEEGSKENFFELE
jgi:very-short-patch-repair endonuclease